MGLLLGSCEGLLTWTLFLLLSAQSHGDCPAPEMPPHATLGGAELNATYPVGSTLRFSCIPGYTVIVGAKRFIECLENSTWSTTPTFCEIKKCRVPVLENGKVESSGDFQFGDTANFTCNYGYKLLGSTSARCTLYEGNNVDWDKAPPHCEQIPCERPPSIANGIHNGDESSDHYTVGTVVTYTCNNDFSLIGNLSIDCVVAADGVNGIWSGPAPECRVVSCHRPEIGNGRLTSGFQPSYSYEHVLQYECNTGYTVLGDKFIKCTANSTWYPDPKCVKESGTTTVPVPPGGNETSRTTRSPGVTVSTVEPGTTQNPSATVSTVEPGTTQNLGATVSTVEPGTTQNPGATVSTVEPGTTQNLGATVSTVEPVSADSATVAVGKQSLIVAVLILIM